MRHSLLCSLLLLPHCLKGQSDPGLTAILQRLDKLERQNQELTAEVVRLREQIAGKGASEPAPLEERVAVEEKRTEELAQSKVEAASKLPISITGMLLFNTFLNSRFNGGQESPTVASFNPVPRTAGATARQTVLGLRFQSPRTVLGALVNGSLFMDFFANPANNDNPERNVSTNLSRLMRLRIATLELDWGSTSFLVGQEKPLISPREPNSLAHVGVSPLTNAGNPWLWQPQARLEHRFSFGESTDVRAQISLFQTAEAGPPLPEPFGSTLESSRPGLEGRIALRHSFSGGRQMEIAPGFHTSSTHVARTSVPSRIYSFDWSLVPYQKLNFSGLFYTGKNTANLGTIRPGFRILGFGNVLPVRSMGGWAQLSYTIVPRLTFNLFGGQHDDRDRDLATGSIGKNFAYAGNAFFRIAPNVLLGFESMQIRTRYVKSGTRLNNHYDLALAYQF